MGRRPGTRAVERPPLDRARIIAITCSILVQALVLAALLQVSRPTTSPGSPDQVIEVTFISRSTAPRSVAPANAARPAERAVPVDPGRVATSQHAPSNDRKAPDAAPAALDLQLVAPPTRFADARRHAFSADQAMTLDAPERLRLEFHDTSIGGRLQAMGMRRDCGELRSALASHPESTESILAAMRTRGCRI